MIWRLVSLYRPYLGWLLLGVVLSLAALLGNIALLTLSGWFISSMALAGAAGVSMNYLTPAAIIRGLAMIRTAGRYGERVVTHEATFRLTASLRSWLYQKIEPLAPAVLATQRSGEILSRLQKDIDRLDAVYLRIALPIVVAFLAVLLCIGFIAMHSLALAVVTLVFLLLGGVGLPFWINQRSHRSGQAQVQLAGRVRTQAIDVIQGMGELLAFGADGRYSEQFNQLNDQWLAQQDRLNRLQSLAQAGQALLAHLAVWTVLLLGIPMLRAAELPPANLAMLALFTLAVFEAIAPLPQAFGLFGETKEAARRVFGLADTPALVAEPDQPIRPPDHPSIRFEGIGLRYPNAEHSALHAIDLILQPGSRTLILGPSGAGKTSLINLLVRFHDPSEGQIHIDQQLLSEFTGEEWRQRIALVSQHTQLISGSIRDNLLLAKPNADESELLAACEQAHIGEFVAELPDGLDTWLGETGVKVSGGQARRIAIARALLKQAPILLLDEPSEGLDRITEQQVMTSLSQLMKGRTVLLITHREVDRSQFDQVLSLDQGELLAL